MNRIFICLTILFWNYLVFANMIIVDINGGGQFTTIQAGINAVAINDTVKVYPGTYQEQINLNKDIVLMGSGYENTIITSNSDPTVTMSAGKLQWFTITSLAGNGINLSGGIVKNCIIGWCADDGISSTTGTASIINCVVVNNARYGILGQNAVQNISVTNCISMWNTFYDYYYVQLSYSNGRRYNTYGNQGCIDQDPLFVSPTDFHLLPNSPCWDTGHPTINDPDGSRSDMGYFGGTDCPIYPIVFEIRIEPSGNTIKLTAKARANY